MTRSFYAIFTAVMLCAAASSAQAAPLPTATPAPVASPAPSATPDMSGAPKAPQPLARPFGRGDVRYHPTLFAPYRFKDTIVRARFDFPRGIVYGHETATIVPKRAGLIELPFNELGLSLRSITVDGQAARYRVDAAKQYVYVRAPHALPPGKAVNVDFVYSAQPQRGLYFIRPDKGYPNIAPEIWSQGEMIDNRRWFPTWDEPNEKTPSELILTVPHGWTAVGNGYLKSHTRSGSHEVWDWRAPAPKSTYLIAFGAGPLAENHTSLGKLPVDSYVPPQYAKYNALCFGRTKDIVAQFQHLIGIPFPWDKEDQIAAERFTYGGMENASVTIQTDNAIHPPIEDAQSPCDGLVAHELAHQWWGDDVTMSDWSNTWINEGYATYFQELWNEHHNGEADFEYERYNAQQGYFGETQAYFRPIVDYVYNDPLDLFDASGYPRPGQVLHMLRYMYGDARFFKALHDYLHTYQYRNADTQQFFTAIDKSLGANLGWFEHEWFYRAAFPNYTVVQSYDAAKQRLTLDVTQHNHDGKPFRMPVVIEAYFNNGKLKRIQPTIDANHQVVTMDGIAAKPDMVLFDPNNNIIRQLTFKKTVDELAYQGAHAAHVGDRLWALEQLAGVAGKDAPAALAQIAAMAKSDPFWGVRSRAVGVAAHMDRAESVAAALADPDKRVRIAAIAAAASLKHPPASLVTAIQRYTNDADPSVAGGAYASLGGMKAPGAYEMLVKALARHSWREQIATGAVRGLGALGDARAMPLLRARTAYGTAEGERSAAILSLARLAVKNKRVAEVEPLVLHLAQTDPIIGTRLAAVNALAVLGDASALPALRAIQANDSQQAVQGSAWEAALTIRDTQAMRAYRLKLADYLAKHGVKQNKPL